MFTSLLCAAKGLVYVTKPSSDVELRVSRNIIGYISFSTFAMFRRPSTVGCGLLLILLKSVFETSWYFSSFAYQWRYLLLAGLHQVGSSLLFQ